MRKMSQQGVDTKKEAAMWKKRAILTAAVAVVVCAVMFGLMVAATEVSKESHVYHNQDNAGRLLVGITDKPENGYIAGDNGFMDVSGSPGRRETTQQFAATARRLEEDGERRLDSAGAVDRTSSPHHAWLYPNASARR